MSGVLHVNVTVTVSEGENSVHCWFVCSVWFGVITMFQIQHHLTEPLMAMVSELNWQKQELITLLRNKDREIADLKAQGINVSRSELLYQQPN